MTAETRRGRVRKRLRPGQRSRVELIRSELRQLRCFGNLDGGDRVLDPRRKRLRAGRVLRVSGLARVARLVRVAGLVGVAGLVWVGGLLRVSGLLRVGGLVRTGRVAGGIALAGRLAGGVVALAARSGVGTGVLCRRAVGGARALVLWFRQLRRSGALCVAEHREPGQAGGPHRAGDQDRDQADSPAVRSPGVLIFLHRVSPVGLIRTPSGTGLARQHLHQAPITVSRPGVIRRLPARVSVSSSMNNLHLTGQPSAGSPVPPPPRAAERPGRPRERNCNAPPPTDRKLRRPSGFYLHGGTQKLKSPGSTGMTWALLSSLVLTWFVLKAADRC